MQTKWLLILLALCAFIGAVLVFGNGNAALIKNWQARLQQPAQTQTRQYIVVYTNGVFSPTNLRVRQGDSIVFRNASATSIKVVGQGISSEDIPAGAAWTTILASSGIFSYGNAYREQEHGTITVTP